MLDSMDTAECFALGKTINGYQLIFGPILHVSYIGPILHLVGTFCAGVRTTITAE